IAQVLLTRFEIENRDAYLHARDTLERLLELGIVPLINENDSVATDEIRFGDNDTLAALVGILVKAEMVVLLSDIDGLYTADPRTAADAQLLHEVAGLTTEIVNAAGAASTTVGSGGMITKLDAARMCMAAGIPMIICEGHEPSSLIDAIGGKQVGTRFTRDNKGATMLTGHADTAQQSHARRLWLALSGSVKGAVTIDDGAALALRKQGGSLLPVGVVAVEGDFGNGSVINIKNSSGLVIGRGLTQYNSNDIRAAAGKNSEVLRQSALLNDVEKTNVVHRDEMVIF
ncbi:MAG: glutamate 5-kinase, partial [Coriobacteriales bacterium]|nr:glutamate 5-kinase [Coriobacteriales bacterium]